ncbi:MAG TPA: superoxide dismutase family protein [Fimbriimonadaceae bacterium]|nr:superoxide dismutase family protein [Fimbriimonadaceae bacterium]
MRPNTLVLIASSMLALGSALATKQSPSTEMPSEAVAILLPTAGNSVSGTVRFTAVLGGVHVVADISGLAPGSKHGFHVHQFGDMSKADGTGMGGHFNPAGVPHALPPTMERHAGDLGNVTADSHGVAHLDATFQGVSLYGRNTILGRGVIVHAKADDGGQPTGNAGARVAQGVIGVAKPSG